MPDKKLLEIAGASTPKVFETEIIDADNMRFFLSYGVFFNLMYSYY